MVIGISYRSKKIELNHGFNTAELSQGRTLPFKRESVESHWDLAKSTWKSLSRLSPIIKGFFARFMGDSTFLWSKRVGLT